MNHTTKMKAWWIILAAAILLVAVLLSSGCVTIKYPPAPCKSDTVFIEREPALKFQPMPYYPYRYDSLGLPLTDTSFLYRGGVVGDSLYKRIAIKVRLITNSKQ